MAARIYSDTPGYKCQCGGVHNKRVPHDDHAEILVPRCNACNKYPSLFHIDADASGVNGEKIRLKIRNDQNNNRLENMSQVIFTLQNIQKEIIEGEFDVTRYVSKEARESFKFKNYVNEYEKHHEQRLKNKELTPKSFKDKKSIIKNHLLPYFRNYDLTKIKAPLIRTFQKSFTAKFRSRDLALGELRTIMRQAVKDGMLRVAPEFDKIPKARKRTKILSMDLINETIQMVPQKIYRDMLTLMTIYPFRPSELRALRWVDIDFLDDKINVVGHFSDEVWIDGRKSISEGENATMKYDIIDRARFILNNYRSSRIPRIDRETDWVFRSFHDKHIYEEGLAKAWRLARGIVGHKHQMYEIRHRCLTDFGKRVNGDIMKLQKFSGHTNANTLMERYIRDDSSLKEFIH